MRRLTALVGAIAALAVGATGSAGAGSTAAFYPTEVSFDFFCGGGFCETLGLGVGDDWMFMGDVKSSKRGCKRDRRVHVYERLDGPDQLMGSDRTDSRGHWLVRRPDYEPTTSVWYAKAPKSKLRPRKFCKRDRSPTIAD